MSNRVLGVFAALIVIAWMTSFSLMLILEVFPHYGGASNYFTAAGTYRYPLLLQFEIAPVWTCVNIVLASTGAFSVAVACFRARDT
ncbi:MAG: hypothetical protein E6R04_11080 [Spirochaetes bacterium]|nr:MAG: hypothetical protein E6R04_11080 [Spirochaetota bacterium]